MSDIQSKTIRLERKQKNTTPTREKSWPIESEVELTQMLELQIKDIKTVVLTVFHTFIHLKWDMEDTKKIQIELLEMKTTVSEMKNTLDGTNGRTDCKEEKRAVNLKK